MTHVYIGPTTPWGLVTNTLCQIVGKRAGGLVIRAEGHRTRFVVAKTHVRVKA